MANKGNFTPIPLSAPIYDVDLPPAPPESGADSTTYRLPSPPTSLPYRVRTIGHIHDNPHHATLGTYFDDAMLLIFLGGKGIYRREGRTIIAKTGMVGLILPGGDSGLLVSDERDPHDHLQCRFAGTLALEAARRIVEAQNGEQIFHFDRWRELAEILHRGVMLWPGREGMGTEPADRLRRVDAVLAEALACLDNPPVERPQRLGIRSMWEYMHAYIGRPIDLDQAATHFGVTKQHLCRVARRELGETFGNTWLAMKIDWAKLLLKRGNMTIAETARHVGFEDPLYFSRVFRRKVGTSPRQWREAGKMDGTVNYSG